MQFLLSFRHANQIKEVGSCYIARAIRDIDNYIVEISCRNIEKRDPNVCRPRLGRIIDTFLSLFSTARLGNIPQKGAVKANTGR
jgi:hypothetical protein